MHDDPALAIAEHGPVVSYALLLGGGAGGVLASMGDLVRTETVAATLVVLFGLTGLTLVYQAAFVFVRTDVAVANEVRPPFRQDSGYDTVRGAYARAVLGGALGLFATGVSAVLWPL